MDLDLPGNAGYLLHPRDATLPTDTDTSPPVPPSIPPSHRPRSSSMHSAPPASSPDSFSTAGGDLSHASYPMGYNDHVGQLVANSGGVSDVDRYPSIHFSSSFGSSMVYDEHPHQQPLPPFDTSFDHQPDYVYHDSSVDSPNRARSMGSLPHALHAHRESHPQAQGPPSHIRTDHLPLLPSNSNDINLSYSIYPEWRDRSSHSQLSAQRHYSNSSIPMSNNWGLSRPSLNSSFDNQPYLPPVNETSPDPTSDSDSGTSMAAVQNIATGCNQLPQHPASSPATSSTPLLRKKKKSKMHPCQVCGKGFPRPSGLSTHMNTHNNARPYICEYPGCQRRFGVRSNAKRHLRTHGVIPQSTNVSGQTPYNVGFSPPVVNQSSVSGHNLVPVSNYRIRWMPPSLTTRTNASKLRQVSEQGTISDDSNDDEDGTSSTQSGFTDGSRPMEAYLSIPLQPAIPSPCRAPNSCACSRCFSSASSSSYSPELDDASFDERSSFAYAGSHPYHPSQFRGLPGPAVVAL